MSAEILCLPGLAALLVMVLATDMRGWSLKRVLVWAVSGATVTVALILAGAHL